jgi:hypothetical protein
VLSVIRRTLIAFEFSWRFIYSKKIYCEFKKNAITANAGTNGTISSRVFPI